MAKITITTDKAGRKVYKVAGTKKYAYSMAKAKEIASKESGTAKRAPVGVRVSKKKPSAAAAKKYAAFEAKLVSSVINDVKGGLAGYKDAARFFKHDPYAAADFYGINEDYVSPAFTRAVLRELKYEIDDLEHLRKEDRAIAGARKSGKLPALRGSGKTTKPKSAARKGTKKRSRQKTGRALYRSRRNPYDPSKRETSPGFLRLESEGALRLAHREQDEATFFGQEAAKYRFSENNVSRIVAEGKRDAALARAKAASLLRDAYLDAAKQAEKETSAYAISRK